MSKLSIIILSLFIASSCSTNKDVTTEAKNTDNQVSESQNDNKGILQKVKSSVTKTFTSGKETEKEIKKIKVNNVNFVFDSYQLSESDQQSLKPLVNFLKANNKSSITIYGHCDSRGTKDYNLILGEKRAIAVKNFLKSQNIAANRIETISFGEEKPLNSGNNRSAYQENRRAEIVIN